MLNKKIARYLHKQIQDKDVYLVKETSDYIENYFDKQYAYSSVQVREAHIQLMKENGFFFDEDHSSVLRLYTSFHDDERYVVPTAVFYQRIKVDKNEDN